MASKKLYISDFRLCDWDHFLIVKGIAVLLVVIAEFLRHFYGNQDLDVLQGVAASMFLLCSGYGISESHRAKNGMPHYWENKVIKLWIPSLAVLVGMSFLQGGNGVSWIEQYPTALYGWFMYIVFGEYAAFWLMFRLSQKKSARVAGVFVISVVAMFFIPDKKITQQLLCFPIGVVFSQYRWKYAVREYGWLGKLLLSVGLLAVAVPSWLFTGSLTDPLAVAAVQGLAYLSTASAVILITYFIRGIKVLGIFAPFGMMAYALYLLNAGIFDLLGKNLQWRTVLITLAVLIAAAAAYSWLIDLFASWNKYMRRKKQTHLKGSMW